MKAYQLQMLDKQRVLYEVPFVNRVANATDRDGRYLVKELKDYLDLDKLERHLNGQAQQEVNYFADLSRRAAEAEAMARQQTQAGGG